MATLGKWSGGAWTSGNLPETWTAPSNLFPTQDRNDGSAYSFTNSTATLTLPASSLADGYLLVARFEYEDNSNGRFNPQLKFIQASGTGNFAGGPTGGYDRDSSEDRAYVHCWAFVDNPSASATFQVQWKADADDAVDGTVRSALEVIPLFYSNVGIYTSTSSSLYGGTTPNLVTGFTSVVQSDTAAIELVSNQVNLKGDNKRYLCLGSQFFEGRGGRTQRWHGFRIDGTKDDAAKAYSYYRNTSNDESGDLFTTIVETSTATITVDQFCYRGDGVASGQGGANIDGSTPGVGDHAIVVLELNDSAEVIKTTGSTNQNIATTGPIDVQAMAGGDIDFNDSASFTSASSTGINAEVAMDALIFANLSAASQNVGSGSRYTGYAEVTVNGTEDADFFAGDYLRNNQGTTDTFGWSANLLGFQALSANDDIGVSCTELAGSEGGGGAVHLQVGWVGFGAINLDTLEGGSDASTTGATTGTGSVTASGRKDASQTGSSTGSGTVSGSASKEASQTGSSTGSGTVSGSAEKQGEATGAISGSGSITATATASEAADTTGTITGTGSTTANAEKDAQPTATATGSGTVLATVQGEKDATGTASAVGSVTASGQKDASQTGTISGSGALTAEQSSDHPASGAVTGTGSLTATATGSESATTTGAINGVGSVAAQARKEGTTDASVVGTGSLTPLGETDRDVSGSVTGSGSISATATSSEAASTTGAISGSGSLTAGVEKNALYASNAAGTGNLTASVTHEADISASISATDSLTASTGASQEESTTGAISGVASLNCAVEKNVDRTGSISSTGTLTEHAQKAAIVVGLVSGAGALTATETTDRLCPPIPVNATGVITASALQGLAGSTVETFRFNALYDNAQMTARYETSHAMTGRLPRIS